MSHDAIDDMDLCDALDQLDLPPTPEKVWRAEPAPLPAAPPPKQETPVPNDTCKTEGCIRPVKFPLLGLCRGCYERARNEKLNGPQKRCSCGATIRKDSTYDDCKACRSGGVELPAPVVAVKKPTAPAAVDGPPANVAEYFAALSNADLALHISAALAERSKRLAGVDALRTAVQ